MKVFILTEGGSKIGFGHLTRCISLYHAFKEKGASPEFVVNGDTTIKDLLKDKNYRIFNWLEEKDKLFEIIEEADIVFIDSYLAKKFLYDKISRMTDGRLIMIDDYNRMAYPKGIVINPSIYGDRLNYHKKDGVVYLLGKEYIILRKEFWTIPEKRINPQVKKVLITFGAMDHSDLAKRVVNCLKNKFDFNFYIVDTQKDKLTAKEILNLMLKADICISGGGQTTYELARVGVPTIGICFAENQRFNLKGWQEKGFIEYIGWHNDNNLLEKIVNAVNKFIFFEERAKRSDIGKDYVDGKGVKRIVSKLMKKS